MHLLSGRSFYKGPDVLSTAGQELFRVLRMELLKDCYHSHYKWRAVDLIGWTSCYHSTWSKRTGVIIHLNSLTLFWLAEGIQWTFEISTCDVITADYKKLMSRTLKITDNHVKFARFVLLPVSEEAKLSLRLRLITLTFTLIILDITKTSSNNCL